MKIIDVSVKRPIGVMMVVLAILALGMVSLRNLAIDLFPKIDLPIAVVATSYQGAAPDEIEKLISRPIEASLSTIQELTPCLRNRRRTPHSSCCNSRPVQIWTMP